MNETAGEVYTPPFYTYSLGGRIALMDAVLAELTCESENKCIYSACMHMCMCVFVLLVYVSRSRKPMYNCVKTARGELYLQLHIGFFTP